MPERGRTQRPITDERRRKYLEALRETGSHDAASRAASPHASGRYGGRTTWQRLRREDDEFREQCEAALSAYQGELEEAVSSRALHGAVVEEKTLPDGTRLVRKQFDVRREQMVLSRLDPSWRSSHQVEVNAKAKVLQATVPFDVKMLERLSKEGRAALRLVLKELAVPDPAGPELGEIAVPGRRVLPAEAGTNHDRRR